MYLPKNLITGRTGLSTEREPKRKFDENRIGT